MLEPCTHESFVRHKDHYMMGPHIVGFVEQLASDPALLGWGVWLVINREDGQVIGDIGFKGQPVDRTVEVGYGILPSAQGKGVATEAVRALLEWAFVSGQVDIVKADCTDTNNASIRVLEKLGMTRTAAKDGMLYWEINRQ